MTPLGCTSPWPRRPSAKASAPSGLRARAPPAVGSKRERERVETKVQRSCRVRVKSDWPQEQLVALACLVSAFACPAARADIRSARLITTLRLLIATNRRPPVARIGWPLARRQRHLLMQDGVRWSSFYLLVADCNSRHARADEIGFETRERCRWPTERARASQ